MTFEQALEDIPNSIILPLHKTIWQEKDIFIGSKCEVPKDYWGLKVDCDSIRPVPEDVQKAMAFWFLYNHYAIISSRSLGWLYCIYPEVDSSEGGIVVACDKYLHTEDNFGIRKFSSKEKIREFLSAIPSSISVIDIMDDHNPFESWLYRTKPKKP